MFSRAPQFSPTICGPTFAGSDEANSPKPGQMDASKEVFARLIVGAVRKVVGIGRSAFTENIKVSFRLRGQSADRWAASVCHPSTLRMLICPETSRAQNNVAAVSADGSTVCVLIPRLNSSCGRLIALVVRKLRHWLGGRRVKVNKFSCLLQAVGDAAMLQPPFADEGFAARFDLPRCRGVDHFVVTRGDLVMQPLGGMGKQVPVLVDRAAQLNRHAIPDRDEWPCRAPARHRRVLPVLS
jgi:hypothetical protein